MANDPDTGDAVVELSASDGVAFIGASSPLTRLHYFDGQYLRAASLTTEQDYHRHALQLANLAGGWGAVQGLGVSLSGDELSVTPGLAVTPAGHLVLGTTLMKAKLAQLLASATPPAAQGAAGFTDCLEADGQPSAKATAGLAVYEITVGPLEGLCGNEPVYGKLCDSACASDSRHPFWREGVVLRLRPVTLALPDSSAVKATTAHQRNRIASGYFAHEPGQPGALLSSAGLAGGVWCEPAQLYGRDEVVIGLLWRDAGVARVDAWSGRRERMDAQPQRYWQGRMAMRPWNVFVAQILQFQCQLSGLFEAGRPVILPEDDCGRLREMLGKARQEIEQLLKRYGDSTKKTLRLVERRPTAREYQAVAHEVNASFADLDGLSAQLAQFDLNTGALPQQRMLLNAGFFTLPPAGYLPVSPGATARQQLERMFGEGVQLQFHAVRADEIGHLVEEAQHLDRISLTQGLDDPKRPEQVEVFLPGGRITSAAAAAPGTWWRLQALPSALLALAAIGGTVLSDTTKDKVVPVPAKDTPPSPAAAAASADGTPVEVVVTKDRTQVEVQRTLGGLLRTEGREDGSVGFALLAGNDPVPDANGELPATVAMYVAGDLSADPFTLPVGAAAALQGELGLAAARLGGLVEQLNGRLTVLAQRHTEAGLAECLVQLDAQVSVATARAGNAPGETRVRALRRRLVLQRDGNADSGFLVLDDERADPTDGEWRVEWDDQPRIAALYVQGGDAGKAVQRRLDRLDVLARQDARAPGADAAQAAADATPAVRMKVVEMRALPAMPAASSALGSMVLNGLAAIADVNDDAGLLMRARRRLFPVLDAPAVQQVVAQDDWVMFRRARTPLCAPACAPVVDSSTETFQVWHLRLDSANQLPALTKALDSGDPGALKGLNPRRVGALRYRDESAYAEESDAQVVAMWQAQPPGKLVALGRVWEAAPATGQGWQNHLRLRHMLEQIGTLTQVPPPGGGELHALPAPPAGLDDKAFDGGMLVVTLNERATPTHRVLAMQFGLFADALPTLQKSPDDGWKWMLENGLGDNTIDLTLKVSGGKLDAAGTTALAETARKLLSTDQPQAYVLHHVLLTAAEMPAGTDPAGEHQQVLAGLTAPLTMSVTRRDEGSGSVGVADFGQGAASVSIVALEPVFLG